MTNAVDVIKIRSRSLQRYTFWDMPFEDDLKIRSLKLGV